MKKLVLLGLAFSLFIVSASAQRVREDRSTQSLNDQFKRGSQRPHDPRITRGERYKLQKEHHRYNKTQKRYKSDGRVSHREKRNLYKMKRHHRHDAFQYRHNDKRRRV